MRVDDLTRHDVTTALSRLYRAYKRELPKDATEADALVAECLRSWSRGSTQALERAIDKLIDAGERFMPSVGDIRREVLAQQNILTPPAPSSGTVARLGEPLCEVCNTPYRLICVPVGPHTVPGDGRVGCECHAAVLYHYAETSELHLWRDAGDRRSEVELTRRHYRLENFVAYRTVDWEKARTAEPDVLEARIAKGDPFAAFEQRRRQARASETTRRPTWAVPSTAELRSRAPSHSQTVDAAAGQPSPPEGK